MVIHHLLYNCVEFLGAPEWLFTNPVFDALHYLFAGLFVFLSGVSSRFSRGNVRRGAIAFALAIGITIVTYFIRMPIWFGVLHLLGFSMLFFGLTRKLWDLMPRIAAPFIYIALIIGSVMARYYIPLTSRHIWMFGWWQRGHIDYDNFPLPPWHPDFVFISFDYFPILPWVFVFLLGTWGGLYIVEKKLPYWFYEVETPFFPAVGRKALLIYILHQPILFGIAMGIRQVFDVGT
jgi:uncharacterized membrane protein